MGRLSESKPQPPPQSHTIWIKSGWSPQKDDEVIFPLMYKVKAVGTITLKIGFFKTLNLPKPKKFDLAYPIKPYTLNTGIPIEDGDDILISAEGFPSSDKIWCVQSIRMKYNSFLRRLFPYPYKKTFPT